MSPQEPFIVYPPLSVNSANMGTISRSEIAFTFILPILEEHTGITGVDTVGYNRYAE